jgi:uncharacterized membrane protein (UPF0127 family)
MKIPKGARPFLLFILVILIVLIIFSSMAPLTRDSNILSEGRVIFNTRSGPVSLNVEVADQPQEITTGLMFREFLGQDEGMLFIFEGDSPRSFWMKNTLIPLDMIFINSSLDIVHIVENAEPCKTPSCQTYSSVQPAMYVVEANSGFVREHDIEPGQKISLNIG